MRNIVLAIFLITIGCNTDAPITSQEEQELDYYKEQHRPQFHFSPEANWMNDPNGMVYHDGEYHLFYQYYPDSTVWGPMHWGHAVSEDMVSWEHLPIALYPDELGYIFSGSAVVDQGNTSGLGANEKDPLIAIFTHHEINGERAGEIDFQYQSIAYSNDGGRTWTKYKGNPVVPNPGIKDFRDPKVIWDEERKQWIMTFAAYDRVRFYTSPNLKEWKFTGEFGIEGDDRLWECPDLFPLAVQGSDETKWILITSIQKKGPNGGTATGYFVGDFDGSQFVGDPDDLQWMDYGTDNYAFVTWSDIPASDGRRLGLGWMSNWQYAQIVPTEVWRSAMTLPRELQLHARDGDYVLRSIPVKELGTIRQDKNTLQRGKLENDKILLDTDVLQHQVDLEFAIPAEGLIQVRLSNAAGEYVDVGYNVSDQTYYIDRTFSGKNDFSDVFADYHIGDATYPKETIQMQLFIDWSSIELFGDGGQLVMTDIFFPTTPFSKLEIITDSNPVELIGGSTTELESIW